MQSRGLVLDALLAVLHRVTVVVGFALLAGALLAPLGANAQEAPTPDMAEWSVFCSAEPDQLIVCYRPEPDITWPDRYRWMLCLGGPAQQCLVSGTWFTGGFAWDDWFELDGSYMCSPWQDGVEPTCGPGVVLWLWCDTADYVCAEWVPPGTGGGTDPEPGTGDPAALLAAAEAAAQAAATAADQAARVRGVLEAVLYTGLAGFGFFGYAVGARDA